MKTSLALCLCAFLSLGAGRVDRYASLLPAIEHVESSGNSDAVGDGGRAVGVLQIHPVMVEDVNRIAKSKKLGVQFTLDDRKDPIKSRHMFRIYSEHYSKDASDEVVARRWNGGPRGERNKATDKYWNKVKESMGGEE